MGHLRGYARGPWREGRQPLFVADLLDYGAAAVPFLSGMNCLWRVQGGRSSVPLELGAVQLRCIRGNDWVISWVHHGLFAVVHGGAEMAFSG